MSGGDDVADLTDAIREAVQVDNPKTQYVLNGVLVIETLEQGEDSPVLHYYSIGDPSPWTKVGMLRAMLRAVDHDLDAGYQFD